MSHPVSYYDATNGYYDNAWATWLITTVTTTTHTDNEKQLARDVLAR